MAWGGEGAGDGGLKMHEQQMVFCKLSTALSRTVLLCQADS